VVVESSRGLVIFVHCGPLSNSRVGCDLIFTQIAVKL